MAAPFVSVPVRRERGAVSDSGAAQAMSFRRAPSHDAHDLNPKTRSTMTIVITAFERSPDGGMGLARDSRVRWALEEVGQPYEVRLVSFKALKEPVHLARNPFGQIPTYEEGDLTLFETGSTLLHIAACHR